MEYTYRQDRQARLEHLYAYRGLPISFSENDSHDTRSSSLVRIMLVRNGEQLSKILFLFVCTGPVACKTRKRARNEEKQGL